MLEEDRESIRKMKADFEEIANLVENDFKNNTGFERQMNHYYTVYSVAIRNTPRTEYTGCDVGELLYMDYQEMLTRYLLRHRDMAAASERELFEKVLTVWKHYKVLMKWNMRAFAYLSRYYIVNNFKPSLEQVAVSIFLEQFFRMHSASVNSVTLDLLDRDRAGECTNKELIKRAIELFTVMKVDDTHFAYKDSFLRDYIAKTEKYCKRVLEEWCGSLSARELTDKIIQSLDEERERCSYFSAEDARQIMACVESVFVGSPSTTRKILDEEGGFRTMLEREETEWLTKCFNLFSTRDTSLKKLADIFAALIVKQGEILSDAYKNEETYVDVVAYVQSMMKLQETFPRVAKLCFNMDFVMSKALREGLEGAYNTSVEVKCKGEESMQVKFCLWLASYADLVLQARVPNPDEELERITVTLSYITERDLFLNSLREKMAGRVLLPVRELNENMERAFIQRIRQRYGPASTSYLEGMLHDILISNDFSVMTKLTESESVPDFDITLLVAKKGIWPEKIFSESKLILPEYIQSSLDVVRRIYLKGTTGRDLSWSHENSSAELVTTLSDKLCTLVLSAPQALILLAFNQQEKCQVRQIMHKYQFSIDLLRACSLPLIKGRLILLESQGGEKIEEDSVFAMNTEFSPKRRKLKIPPTLLRMNAADELAGQHKVYTIRKPAVDACIIKVMKSRRLVSHKDLVVECKKQLSTSFDPDIKIIKTSIEDLIKRDFIERDQNSEGYKLDGSPLMKFYLDEILVVFPYEYIYPEQLEYITELKRGLDSGGHMVLEMPSGTGKTISLLSILVAYLHHHAHENRKVVYCTRTVEEMTKTMGELKKLLAHWEMEGEPLRPLRGICLTAKKNLCIEPGVSSLLDPSDVDTGCRAITAPWQRDSRCQFFDTLEEHSVELPPGVYSPDDLKSFARENGVCPYYLARKALKIADIIVHSYLYIVDPVVSEVTNEYLNENTIVVMDEGHNVDDVCIEAMSLIYTKKDSFDAKENLKDLEKELDHLKSTNRQQLQSEYDRLVNGLALAEMARESDGVRGEGRVRPPEIPQDVAEQAVPGSLRAASHFLSFMQRLIDFTHRIVTRISRTYVADPLTFLTKVREECALEVNHFRYLFERLKILLSTLQITNTAKYRPISLAAHLFTILAVHYTDDRHEKPGFVVVCEAHDPSRPQIPDPVLRCVCVDASLALRPAFSKYKSVILTSGTLSPLDIYPKILGFTPTVSKSFSMTLSRKCIAPVIVTRSSESVSITSEEITSSFKVRNNPVDQAIVSNAYESLLMELSKTVPDGIVCFFTGYQYMSEVLLSWYSSGFLQELAKYKLIFIETQGVEETSVALANYRKACDIGRGAIFMSIARGKIAEGIDFDRHYGRAVIMFGVPFLPPNDEPVKQRMHWMEICLGISESEFRNFDAMRQASQCIGRVLRNKTDYGMMLLVDRRFSLNDKKKKLPPWILQNLKENSNLSVDASIAVARAFFKEMAQPWEHEKDLGTTLLSKSTLAAMGRMKPSSNPALVVRENNEETESFTGPREIITAQREPFAAKRPREE